MAAADAAVKPSTPPPPARIVVAVLVLVRVVVRALVFLAFAVCWFFSAIGAAMVVAHLVWGHGSAPFVFLMALAMAVVKVCCTFLLVALVAAVLCDRFLVEFVSRFVPEFEKSPFEAAMEESTQGLFRCYHVVVLGFFADLAFLLLVVTGILVLILSSAGEGSTSQGEMIGSVILDVGLFGIYAIFCFAIIPAVLLGLWRKGQFCLLRQS